MKSDPIIIIIGATASGKTQLAIELAKIYDAEIISADSRQVYKGMDIGTGKDLETYHENKILYHLIDIKEPGEKYHVDAFKTDFFQIYQQLQNKGRRVILCGGTALYINSLIQPSEFTSIPVNQSLREYFEQETLNNCINKLKTFPSEQWAHVDFNSKKRVIRALEIADFLKVNPKPINSNPTLNPIFIGLVDELNIRRTKIKDRLSRRFQEGLIQEVQALYENGLSFEMMDYYGLEYKFVSQFLQGNLTYFELENQLFNGICQYAKRQMTFFRKMDREGANIKWINASNPISNQIKEADTYLKQGILTSKLNNQSY